jgi:hypothetical protein
MDEGEFSRLVTPSGVESREQDLTTQQAGASLEKPFTNSFF